MMCMNPFLFFFFSFLFFFSFPSTCDVSTIPENRNGFVVVGKKKREVVFKSNFAFRGALNLAKAASNLGEKLFSTIWDFKLRL